MLLLLDDTWHTRAGLGRLFDIPYQNRFVFNGARIPFAPRLLQDMLNECEYCMTCYCRDLER